MYWEEQNNSWISRFFLLYLLYSKTIKKKPKYIRPTATIAVLYIFDCSNEYVVFKGTVSRDFWPFFCLKDSTTNKKVTKNVILYFRKLHVRVVNDYPDYADTSMNTQTLFENFEGFSQMLKEQSGKNRYLGVFTLHIQ